MSNKNYTKKAGGKKTGSTKTAGKSKSNLPKGVIVARIIAVLIALVLVAYLITVIVLNSWNPANWTKRQTPGTNNETDQVTDTKPLHYTIGYIEGGEQIIAGYSYEMPEALLLTAPLSNYEYVGNTEFTITATLLNPYIKDASFEWSVSFVDDSIDKSLTQNFIQVEPLTNSAMAKVKFISQFDKQILITVKLRGGDKTASCTVDCLKTFDMGKPELCTTEFIHNINIDAPIEFSTGTVEGDIKFTGLGLYLQDEFVRFMQNHLNFEIACKGIYFTPASFENSELYFFEYQNKTYLCFDAVGQYLDYSMFIMGFEDFDDEHKEAIYYAWYKAYNEFFAIKGSYILLMDVDFSYYYGDIIVEVKSETDVPTRGPDGYVGFYEHETNIILNPNIVF